MTTELSCNRWLRLKEIGPIEELDPGGVPTGDVIYTLMAVRSDGVVYQANVTIKPGSANSSGKIIRETLRNHIDCNFLGDIPPDNECNQGVGAFKGDKGWKECDDTGKA